MRLIDSHQLILITLLAISATLLSAVTSWPQVLLSWRSKHRHDIAVLALTGSLFVSGSWACWSLRVHEPLAAAASTLAFIGHALVLLKARGNRLQSLWAVPALIILAYLPITAVEVVTSAAALATLIPHLASAVRAPDDVSAARWYLEAGEELLWGCWALAMAAPLVALPSLVYVPVAIAIALSASARRFNSNHRKRLAVILSVRRPDRSWSTRTDASHRPRSWYVLADNRTIAEKNLSEPSQPPGVTEFEVALTAICEHAGCLYGRKQSTHPIQVAVTH